MSVGNESTQTRRSAVQPIGSSPAQRVTVIVVSGELTCTVGSAITANLALLRAKIGAVSPQALGHALATLREMFEE